MSKVAKQSGKRAAGALSMASFFVKKNKAATPTSGILSAASLAVASALPVELNSPKPANGGLSLLKEHPAKPHRRCRPR